MDSGRIIAIDTPHNIKKKLGIGYNLRIRQFDSTIKIDFKYIIPQLDELILFGFSGVEKSDQSLYLIPMD